MLKFAFTACLYRTVVRIDTIEAENKYEADRKGLEIYCALVRQGEKVNRFKTVQL